MDNKLHLFSNIHSLLPFIRSNDHSLQLPVYAGRLNMMMHINHDPLSSLREKSTTTTCQHTPISTTHRTEAHSDWTPPSSTSPSISFHAFIWLEPSSSEHAPKINYRAWRQWLGPTHIRSNLFGWGFCVGAKLFPWMLGRSVVLDSIHRATLWRRRRGMERTIETMHDPWRIAHHLLPSAMKHFVQSGSRGWSIRCGRIWNRLICW